MKIYLSIFFSVVILTFLFNFSANAQIDSKSNKNEKQQDRPLKIKSVTPPDRSLFGRCFEDKRNAQLQIEVKVTFHSSGKVTDAEIVKASGCGYFDKECLRIVKKIKFNPEIKNGEAITIIKPMRYNAYIY